MAIEFSRRQLFRLRLGDLPAIARSFREQESASPDEKPAVIRPPGALRDEGAFLASCERCHACADACPFDVIENFTAAYGRLEGTPFLNPEEAPCRWCADMPCIAACPSGALAGSPPPPIAKAEIDLDACLNTQGILCDTCASLCPPQIRAIRMVSRKPQLDSELCVGCGLCAYHCEAEPGAIRVVAC